ncbi:hypothetical protein HK101_003288 [Irineochytrium annulatum]|nr:hypothetical protein HK101_003288 [Irineochytrium annulatum]
MDVVLATLRVDAICLACHEGMTGEERGRIVEAMQGVVPVRGERKTRRKRMASEMEMVDVARGGEAAPRRSGSGAAVAEDVEAPGTPDVSTGGGWPGSEMLVCEACALCIGHGSVGVPLLPSSPTSSSSTRKRPSPDDPAVPDLSIEPLCARCVREFDFCTNCGGGGTYRTGKYRPREMFARGKRTCGLGHVRVGDATPLRITTYVCPVNVDELETWDPVPMCSGGGEVSKALTGGALMRVLMEDILRLMDDAYLGDTAISSVMRRVPHLSTHAKLVERLRAAKREMGMHVCGGWLEENAAWVKGSRRYLAVRRMVEAGGAGAAPGRRRKETEEMKGERERVALLGGRVMGYACVEYNVRDRVFLFGHARQLGGRKKGEERKAVNLAAAAGTGTGAGKGKNGGPIMDALEAELVMRVEEDVRAGVVPRPLHVWVPVRRALTTGRVEEVVVDPSNATGVRAAASDLGGGGVRRGTPEVIEGGNLKTEMAGLEKKGFKVIGEYARQWGVDEGWLDAACHSGPISREWVRQNFSKFVIPYDELLEDLRNFRGDYQG